MSTTGTGLRVADKQQHAAANEKPEDRIPNNIRAAADENRDECIDQQGDSGEGFIKKALQKEIEWKEGGETEQKRYETTGNNPIPEDAECTGDQKRQRRYMRDVTSGQ